MGNAHKIENSIKSVKFKLLEHNMMQRELSQLISENSV